MQTIGSQVAVKIVKNKHAPPFRTAEFELEFGKGISLEAELIELGCKYDLITKAGSFFRINDRAIQGKDAFKRYLSENLSVRDELMAKLREKLSDSEKESKTGSIDESAASDTTDEEAVAAVEA